MNTLKLDINWDLTLDSSRNIAVLTGGAALAQDVASAISLFSGELYYNTSQGVPWFGDVLGRSYSKRLIETLLERAALTVPTVVSAQAVVSGFSGRTVTGEVRFIDSTGAENGVSF